MPGGMTAGILRVLNRSATVLLLPKTEILRRKVD
jgi:hypothetical protein